MDIIIRRWGSLEFSPYTKEQSSHIAQTSFAHASIEPEPIPWIRVASEFAQSGIAQAAILFISIAWLAVRLLWRRDASPGFKAKASSVRWAYESLSQVARFTSAAFFAVAYVRGHTHLLNVVLLAYISILGLFRLVNDIQWRHVALHHINSVIAALLLVLTSAQFLPCVQDGIQCTRDTSIIGGFAALAAAAVFALITPREWVPPTFEYEIPGYNVDDEPAPEETCSWLNYYVTYEWLTPLVVKGSRGLLDVFGIPKLAWYDEPLYLLRKVQDARAKATSTMWTALRYQSRELTLMSVWIALSFVAENIAPFALFKLLEYLANPDDATYRPWVWLVLMFAGPMTYAVLFQQYVFTSTRLIVRVKSGFTQELYHRALGSMELDDDPFEQNRGGPEPKSTEPDAKSRTTSAGRLANLMAADVDAIYRARDIIQVCVGVPVGTAVSLIGLYRILAWPALVGFGILVISAPISIWFSRLMYHTQRNVRRSQDARISLVTEYLSSIRAIKYFGWERSITNKIVNARAKEQKGLWRVSVLQIMINEVNSTFPCIALVVMFLLHVGLQGERLQAATAFTTVLLVENLRGNIMRVSYLARSTAGALVAFGRLDKYFESTVPIVKHPIGPLRIDKACFRRTRKAVFHLEDISLDFVQGGLNVVGGQSGSGKSTLLLAILGETYLESGQVTAPDDIAFASQSAWLQNTTIQDNILFGSPMEVARYKRVLKACCLSIDLQELSERDQTVVGENGTSLSGGQRARVALARALYSKAPLLLLDDIFSALDAKTAAGVWKYCFCGDLLKGRTTVLVTQVPWIPLQADLSIILDKGRVVSAEQNLGVVRKPIAIAEVLGGDADDAVGDVAEPETPPELEMQTEANGRDGNGKSAKADASKNIVNQEMKSSGKVGHFSFLQYMRYFGHPLFAITCVVALAVANGLTLSIDYWLAMWVEAYNNKAHVDIAFYVGIFILLNASKVIGYGAVLVISEWGAWKAARKLHNDFIHSIMAVPLSWFKTTPIGRVTNRFSGDMASIDGNLCIILLHTLDSSLALCFKIGAVGSIMPVFILPALFTCVMGIVIGDMYTKTVVVVRRLTSSAQSPVFSLFGDTLAGLPVIRARAGKKQAFAEDLAEKLRVWSASSQTNYNCNRWVGVRVALVTALVSLCAGIIAVSKVGVVTAGLVGFSLTNANSLSETIINLVRSTNELEVEMQSFQRVKEYVKLEREDANDEPYPEEGDYADDDAKVIPKNWPQSGDVEFRNVTVRYEEDGPDILIDVNLKFKAGERVAVVGRTGSGKSTLILSLLRFTHVVSGQILYDGIDITNLPRHKLREALTIIPQEPVLFNGTVESNLDPGEDVPKETLEKALDNCRGIASFSAEASSEEADSDETRNHEQGLSLSTEVTARGENFSHGQRQVLSLCRALIRKNKIMLLDEATASMDYETDRGIQQTLRAELESEGGNRTLVTVAHRLRTIIDYNTVVVMAAGKVVECDSPRNLYNAKGQFYDMVVHSGEVDELQDLLEKEA